jgi:general secretion pathway protein H
MISPSRPAGRKISAAGGFTLIEIMVVVVIIGVVSAMLIISFNLVGSDRELRTQATRLASILELTVDEATLQGRDYGLEIMRGGYRFVEFDPFVGRWNEVIGDDLLRPRVLEDDLEFELTIEERRITLEDNAADISVDEEDEDEDELAYLNRQDERSSVEDYQPHVLILSSGDASPFELKIVRSYDQQEISLVMLIDGQLEIRTEEDEAT